MSDQPQAEPQTEEEKGGMDPSTGPYVCYEPRCAQAKSERDRLRAIIDSDSPRNKALREWAVVENAAQVRNHNRAIDAEATIDALRADLKRWEDMSVRYVALEKSGHADLIAERDALRAKLDTRGRLVQEAIKRGDDVVAQLSRAREALEKCSGIQSALGRVDAYNLAENRTKDGCRIPEDSERTVYLSVGPMRALVAALRSPSGEQPSRADGDYPSYEEFKRAWGSCARLVAEKKEEPPPPPSGEPGDDEKMAAAVGKGTPLDEKLGTLKGLAGVLRERAKRLDGESEKPRCPECGGTGVYGTNKVLDVGHMNPATCSTCHYEPEEKPA